MLPWETLATARTTEGKALTLVRRGTEYAVRVDGRALMSSQTHFSEEALARLAFDKVSAPERVLIGGLGLGFTLRAVLDRLPPTSTVVVAELSEALLEWNRTVVAELAKKPLEDPRVEVRVVDVLKELKRCDKTYDAILLDVDNGPTALTQVANEALYGEAGVFLCLGALKPGGVLTVWSAGPDDKYVERLQRAGFDAKARTVTARPDGGARHVVFVASKVEARRRRERRER